MTLEDFFTLNEMKNGLSTLPRVEELISVIKKQQDCALNNAGDTARQRSTVAGTLAVTENKDCLNYFIQLNGLLFLNQWLQEALKCSNDGSSSTMEEVINSLLGSLERLPVDKESLTTCGIWATVEKLLGQNIPSVKERVQYLLAKWNDGRVNDVSNQDIENGGTCQGNQHKPSADANTIDKDVPSPHPVDISPCNLGTEEVHCRVNSAGTDNHLSNFTKHSDIPDTINDEKISMPNQTMPNEYQNSANANANIAEINASGSSHVSNSCQDNFSITEESVPVEGMASADLCSSPVGKGKDAEKQSEASELRDVDCIKEMQVETSENITEDDLYNDSQKESCNALTSGVAASLSAQKRESAVSCNFDSMKSKLCASKNEEPQPMNKGTDCGLSRYLSTAKELKSVAHVGKCSQDLLSNEHEPSKTDGSESSFQRKEALRCDGGSQEQCSKAKLKVSEGMNLGIPCGSPRTVSLKVTGEMDQSEMELECVEIDALEVARQVAREVEREVVDYREPFCSSSPEIDSGERMEICSPELEEGKQNQPMIVEHIVNESSTGKDLSDSSSSLRDDNSGIPAQCNIDTERHDHDVKPELKTVAPEADCKVDKNVWAFDLNEVVRTEDDDLINSMPNNQVSLTVPKAIVAASKGAPELPVSPLHFEGELGWRGSAATSAFRPASPRRTPDAEKTCLGPKGKTSLPAIDLNVAECEDNVAVDSVFAKQIPHSFGLPFGKSSVEVNSRRIERLKLDLNRLGDEDMSPCASSFWKLHQQNGDHHLSNASSFGHNPSMKDFDLNDNPSLFEIGGSHNLNKPLSKASGMPGSSELDDSVITIMGSRMAVQKGVPRNQTQPSYLGNAPSLEPAFSARQMLPYAHMPPPPPPAYGYNGLVTGHAMPHWPALYGPGSIPYMVDSRGAPVVPQILGSASAGLSGAASAMPPFLMSVGSAPMSLNGSGSSHSSLDLNSGMTFKDSGIREPGGFRQYFMQGPNGLMEEQSRTTSQLASSGMTLKRKEPDCGFLGRSGGALEIRGIATYKNGPLKKNRPIHHAVGGVASEKVVEKVILATRSQDRPDPHKPSTSEAVISEDETARCTATFPHVARIESYHLLMFDILFLTQESGGVVQTDPNMFI